MNNPFPEIPKTPKKPPEHLLTLEEAEERLNPHKELLETCIQHAWDEWRSFYAAKHLILDARARAAIVFSEIVALAQQKFSGLDGVKFTRRQNSFWLYVGDDIIIRFKKLKKNGACSSIDTRQQMLFKAQMSLPTMEAGTLLHAGYALDVLQTEIERKLIVCQFKNRVLWTISLTGAAGEAGGKIEIMPSTPPPQPPNLPRWESKIEAAKKKGKKPKVLAITAGKE